MNDRGHCALWYLQSCRNLLVPFSRSMPWHNPVSEVYREFLWPLSFVFALTCTVSCGTLCKQLLAIPNHVQLIEFTTGGLQSSCRNTSRITSGNKMHLNSVWVSYRRAFKLVNYDIWYFSKSFDKLAQMSKCLFSLWHYGLFCVEFWEKKWTESIVK